MQTVTTAPSNYEYLYETMRVNDDKIKQVKDLADVIYSHVARYNAFVKQYFPLMPWYYVGILHMMERKCDFNCHLSNGDSLKYRTHNVPMGRPLKEPANGFSQGYMWEESALDIFRYFMYDKKQSWAIPEMLARFEGWNGMAYQRKNMCSPYLWSFTNHYTKGKFVADHKFDPDAVSKQAGAAPLLKSILDRLAFEKQSLA